ncbi:MULTISPECIES: NADPH:quinone oxidoreductase family protein [unclassified Bradyrhizobium]|uniref:quinone oxidoreductase family protein n=1 Tax=unclassified Bradyrhizobium TaxID=2631580 RepID=UPI001FF348B1|nr:MULTISPECIES: NADPH:quinone oxidoreductase family protein [unclassified Bradyrhizobium]MCJ9703802.1 NADPH:quinone oxidoreductase family protein [Bradyrhizobium sp. SHOUNA76]MCJ9731903.1 NADPH:quinone oxidoreductase family protein [Bradyrhizobium sp. PRIMUS42]
MLVYEDAPKPAPAAGEVLIKVESASVNFADVVRRNNDPYPSPSPLPFIPGSEIAGVVEALGDGATTIPVGAKVFASLENGGAGGYAQYAVAKVGKVIPLPDGLTPDQACSLVVAGMTAFQTLADCAQLRPGETVLVQAAGGGVGTYAVQLAKLLGAGKVIAAASTPAKRELALKLGADAALDYTKPDWVKEARELTAGKGIDVVLEATGGDVLNQSLQAMGPFGRIVVFGAASRERKPVNPYAMLGMNQSLITYYVGGWFQSRPQQAVAALQKLIGFIKSGAIDVQIGHTLPLSKAADAHRLLAERASVGKIILKPWGEAA